MKYKHYKGAIYTVIIDDAKHSETLERMVIYKGASGGTWVRPYPIFHGLTAYGVKRFELVEQ